MLVLQPPDGQMAVAHGALSIAMARHQYGLPLPINKSLDQTRLANRHVGHQLHVFFDPNIHDASKK
jgi:hypothetical protein